MVVGAFTLFCKKTEHAHPDSSHAPAIELPPAGARVFFIEPKDGAFVKGSVKVKMGVEGMAVKPAGPIIPGSGHHHILINAASMEAGKVIPMDDAHRHFGKGQTQTELTLKPGKNRLTLQFADGLHRSYGPSLSQTITITVK